MQTGSENVFSLAFHRFQNLLLFSSRFLVMLSSYLIWIRSIHNVMHTFCVCVYKKWDMAMFRIQQFKNQRFSMKSFIFMLSLPEQCLAKLWFPLRMPKTMKSLLISSICASSMFNLHTRSADFYGEPGEMLFEKHSEEVFFISNRKLKAPNHLSWVIVSFCRFFCLTFYMLLLKWIREKKAK